MVGHAAVWGIGLLAPPDHRTVDPVDLTRLVTASKGPVVVAGSIDRTERIQAVARAGAWAFTIGSAIFDGVLPGAPDLDAQIEWTLQQSH